MTVSSFRSTLILILPMNRRMSMLVRTMLTSAARATGAEFLVKSSLRQGKRVKWTRALRFSGDAGRSMPASTKVDAACQHSCYSMWIWGIPFSTAHSWCPPEDTSANKLVFPISAVSSPSRMVYKTADAPVPLRSQQPHDSVLAIFEGERIRNLVWKRLSVTNNLCAMHYRS